MPHDLDAAFWFVNAITELGPSQEHLTCRLTQAFWWYRPPPARDALIASRYLVASAGWSK